MLWFVSLELSHTTKKCFYSSLICLHSSFFARKIQFWPRLSLLESTDVCVVQEDQVLLCATSCMKGKRQIEITALNLNSLFPVHVHPLSHLFKYFGW